MGGDERSLGAHHSLGIGECNPDSRVNGNVAMNVPTNETAHAWRPPRFMVIAAHPDDADFGPAATAAAWIDAGSVGWLVCCTSGDAGGEDPDLDPGELGVLREAEQQRAVSVVGYAGVTFLHQPDGALESDLALRELLVREIRTFRPDAILATDPEVVFYRDGGVNHSDHRAAGMAAVDAVYPAARNPMAFPDPNVWVDVSGTVERKIEALRAHASQIHEPDKLETRIREWAGQTGAKIGAAGAEAFRLVIIEDDEDEGPTGMTATDVAEASDSPEAPGAAVAGDG